MNHIITGDIINSRQTNPNIWIKPLSNYLNTIGKRPKSWDIYRGDSFQIKLSKNNSLEVAILIKALIKSNKNLDSRLSIGIGNINYESNRVTQSNGSAFINSGESFDNLGKYSLDIKTPFQEINEYFSSICKLLNFIIDTWKPVTADTIFHALSNQHLNQKELANLLNKKESTISEALKRGGYHEIILVLNLFQRKIASYDRIDT